MIRPPTTTRKALAPGETAGTAKRTKVAIQAAPVAAMAHPSPSVSDRAYTEPRDNACSPHYLPLLLQRFQLAMYGMDNFKPKSTDWLRVTLFQGAPRPSDLGNDTGDDWVLPPRPGRQA